MKRLVLVFGFIFLTKVSFAQDYKKHVVKTGETVYSITKKYNVSEDAIYQLNPDAKNGIAIGKVLLIPASDDSSGSSKAEVSFQPHKVKRKETLYSLSKKYNVSADDIKKYNPKLYAEPLKKGDVIKIPIISEEELDTVVSTKNNDTVLVVKQHKITHTVVAKETKFGIAKQYGISPEELEKQNPHIKDGLKIGQELTIVKVEDVPVEDNGTEISYSYYTVQSQDTFYSLEKSLGLNQEEIIKLNPKFADGLKVGMLLKYPKEGNVAGVPDNMVYTEEKVNLQDQINNFNKKKIALMLPLRLERVPDSSRTRIKEYLETNRLLNATLEFYSGVMVAADSLKSLGISTEIKVFDTENDFAKTTKIMESEDFSEYDAVIGPMFPKNIEKVSRVLETSNIPVISPLTTRPFTSYKNTFQTMPSNELMRDHMIQYIDSTKANHKLFLISDSKSTAMKELIKSKFPEITMINARKDEYIVADLDLKPKLDINRENWFIVETDNDGLVVNIVTALNALKAKYNIRVMTTASARRFKNDDVKNEHLANLNYHFPTTDLEFISEEENSFVEKYKSTYDIVPNRVAIRGFDLTMDVLLRLSVKETLVEGCELGETEYVENKFNFSNDPSGGFINNAFYIARYTEELTIEKVNK